MGRCRTLFSLQRPRVTRPTSGKAGGHRLRSHANRMSAGSRKPASDSVIAARSASDKTFESVRGSLVTFQADAMEFRVGEPKKPLGLACATHRPRDMGEKFDGALQGNARPEEQIARAGFSRSRMCHRKRPQCQLPPLSQHLGRTRKRSNPYYGKSAMHLPRLTVSAATLRFDGRPR